MKRENCIVKDIKIAYVGGGSRGWAWTFMNDLAKCTDISGTVYLYDIDYEAALNNEKIGNNFPGEKWSYKAAKTACEALTGADFVIISILPATFKEMEYDVHTPEKYGIFQSVGDTAGPGGFMRALRTVPMMREIARNIRRYCPDAWVINYTNPMSICVGALYREFPEIKAYGCCHEVFGTQKLLLAAYEEMTGNKDAKREDVSVNVVGVNHFTWFTSAYCRGQNMFDLYAKFVDKFYETGYSSESLGNWMNDFFASNARVRMDLFKRFGYIAAAGDRHLAEFMDFEDYLADCKKWMFSLTPVSWRWGDLARRLERSTKLLSGEETWELKATGEEGTVQIRALLGLGNFVTNINTVNRGQIANLPEGAIVETNAAFRDSTVSPVYAGRVPDSIYPLISRALRENEMALDSAFSLDISVCRENFKKLNMLKKLTDSEKDTLFTEMYEGTKEYLKEYN